MKFVTYQGPADFQKFSKADFEKAGADQGDLQFARGQAVKVKNATADVLTASDGVFGGYNFVAGETAPDDDEEAQLQAEKDRLNAEGLKASASTVSTAGAQGTPPAGATPPVTPATSTPGSPS